MSIVSFDLVQFKNEISNDKNSIGRLIGITDHNKKVWLCAIYVGNQKLAVLYDGSLPDGIVESNFKPLLENKNLAKTDFIKINFDFLIDFDKFKYKQTEYEFFIYRINLFDTSRDFNLNTIDLVKTMQSNFRRLHNFDECDVVRFHRGTYSHHGLLTDKLRMIVTHRWGEPEDGGQLYVVSTSLLGLPTEKACVSEDHLIEVAGYREISKSNHLYDRTQLPKSKEEILAEAKKRVGEKGYSITKRNCQHFVSECRNGTSCSPEVQGVVTGMLFTAAAGFLTLAGVGVYTFLSGRNKDEESKKEKQQRVQAITN